MTLDISAIRQRIERLEAANRNRLFSEKISYDLFHAPADLRALCDEVEKLRAELEKDWIDLPKVPPPFDLVVLRLQSDDVALGIHDGRSFCTSNPVKALPDGIVTGWAKIPALTPPASAPAESS